MKIAKKIFVVVAVVATNAILQAGEIEARGVVVKGATEREGDVKRSSLRPCGGWAVRPQRRNTGRDKTTYANPIIPGDYSDPDVIRVGDDYYMVTSSFQMSPGVPVLHSRDLVNWKTIGAAIPDLTMVSDDFRPERMNEYNRGIYAPSIRYHNKKFYVYVPSLDDGIIVSIADRPEGPWTADWLRKADGTPWKARRRTDPCPYWDGKGNGWLALSWLDDGWNGWLYKLSDDGLRLLDDGWRFSPYRSTEGHKIYFRNGYHYLVHIEFLGEGNGQGTYIMRSRDINGPYEMLKVNLDIPGQGCLVDLPDGRWVWIAQFNTPGEPNGRKPEMLPVEWIDDWPVIGVEPKDLHGKFAKRLPLPLPLAKDAEAQGSDNFDAPTLDPMWQWNHVPEDGAWSLTERKGWMRIKGRAGRPFFKTPNALCQRVLQREDGACVSVKVDGAMLRVGEAAGLALFNGGRNYAIDGIVREDGKLKRFFEKDGERTILGDVKGTVATLAWEVKGAVCTSATEKMAEIRGANYRGINAGLYATGTADFDDFTLDYTR